MGKRQPPCVLNDIKKKEICAILAVGCNRKTAAAYVGCAVSTIYRTAQRNETFATDLRRAESHYEVSHLKNIKLASEKNWRASAWALERRFPDQYGQRRAGTVTSQEIAHVLGEFARIVAAEVSVDRTRRSVLRRLGKLTKQFERDWDYQRQLGTAKTSRKRRPAP